MDTCHLKAEYSAKNKADLQENNINLSNMGETTGAR